MKTFHSTLAVLGLAAALAACGQKQPVPTPPVTPPASAIAPMAPMGTGATAAPKTGDSTGEITAIDAAAGTVTLKHQPIPGVGWPAMTMAFKATPTAPLTGLKVGDKVKFSVRIEGDKNLVTAISKP